ncbi:HAD family hydrolase [Vibrio galatheae]|uniref:HAD family hydrolase n=1 Tax=Vibrio galatheae TaxID=579748 RepID=A0A0F4NED2_9VIBR|nr:HAD family hydrolase [Vibrio galatheae]KJY81457.1 HAD family hydrolase [Vibrio galatheae]
MPKPLYVFDMDDTLINGDCAMIWNEFLVEKGIATSPYFIEEDQRLMDLYAQGKLDMQDYLNFCMAPLCNLSVEQVKDLAQECVERHILSKQFKQSQILIEQLARDDIDMVIISASVTFLVEAVGLKLGIPTVLGIDLVEKENGYSAQILGIPSYREGKVTRLKAWLDAQANRYSTLHFYTDSINDLPLCEYADYTYLVNPCPRLKAQAKQTNWTILSWD